MTQQRPDWDVVVIDGQPEMVLNAAMVRALMRDSPLGEHIARQRLIAAGFPAHLLNEPGDTTTP
ncbi:hypothetical protein ACL02O_23700 [Micromonospora sp. MS34]|uniref:hypothetical protein n=1 Tax=Micromonospora sp. MS34 TaxID=3385971 RepID=UPI0039A3B6B8